MLVKVNTKYFLTSVVYNHIKYFGINRLYPLNYKSTTLESYYRIHENGSREF